MSCNDCCYCWKEDGDVRPCCHWSSRCYGDIPPCEEMEEYIPNDYYGDDDCKFAIITIAL